MRFLFFLFLTTGILFGQPISWDLKSQQANQKSIHKTNKSYALSQAADRSRVSLTIYNSGMGLVRESRQLQMKQGVFDIRFEDVAAKIIPQTVRIENPTEAKFSVHEQNYQYDLISRARLLKKYIGKEVIIYRKNPTSGAETPVKARLISMNKGPVFQIGEEIALGYPGRITVASIPENLYSRPTLIWRVASPVASKQTLNVSYQTNGLGWSSDYVMVLNDKEEQADLNCWVTLNNTSGTEYLQAELQLLAGDVQRKPNYYRRKARAMMEAEDAVTTSAPSFRQENLSDYYIYTLDSPVDLRENQMKQIQMFQSQKIPVTKSYVIRNLSMYRKRPTRATVEYSVQNNKKSNLGRPLPRGTIRVFKLDSQSRQQLLGEDRIDHISDGQDFKVTTGKAFDVMATGKRMEYKKYKIGKGYQATYRVEIQNRKKEPATVRYYLRQYGDWQLKTKHTFHKESANEYYVDVNVDGKSSQIIKYQIDVNQGS